MSAGPRFTIHAFVQVISIVGGYKACYYVSASPRASVCRLFQGVLRDVFTSSDPRFIKCRPVHYDVSVTSSAGPSFINCRPIQGLPTIGRSKVYQLSAGPRFIFISRSKGFYEVSADPRFKRCRPVQGSAGPRLTRSVGRSKVFELSAGPRFIPKCYGWSKVYYEALRTVQGLLSSVTYSPRFVTRR
jgi:hypothetical protein